MSRITELFSRKFNNVLNVYCTAGYPQLHSTLTVMKALEDAGVDIIELGMPYSDPLADGPVIQHSSAVALNNGMSLATLFGQLEGFRNRISVPVVLMGYLNPILQFGFEQFCSRCADVGVDGLIIPDLPMAEFEREYSALLQRYGLDFTFLITPETSDERIRKADSLSSGFLYAVSSSSLTGSDKDFSAVEDYLQRLEDLQLNNPVLVGFGVKDKKTFQQVCRHANGAIIGSAFIKALGSDEDLEDSVKNFVRSVIDQHK